MFVSNLKRTLFVAVSVIWISSWDFSFATLDTTQSHLGKEDCATCHLAGANVTSEDAHLLLANQETLCKSCHPKSLEASHPTGLRPTNAIPTAYPLDWTGNITCSTCHNIHGNTTGLPRTDKQGRDLCLDCHTEEFFNAMPDGGASLINAGHMSTEADLSDYGIDEYSIQCLDCHMNKGDINLNSRSRANDAVMRHTIGGLNHPIGQYYANSRQTGKFHPESEHAETILLPNGQVSCVSCHQPYTQEHGKLTVPKGGSRLCFECHDI